MTVDRGKTNFPFVLAKDPKRRKSRPGSNAGRNPSAKSQALSKNNKRQNKSGINDAAGSPRTARNGRKGGGQFVLYVEGARDREILECWARRIDSSLMRCIESNTVILGGRQPARAIADFQKRGGLAAGYSGLIVLDRDDYPRTTREAGFSDSLETVSGSPPGEPAVHADGVTQEVGLEVFVWTLRHIESYLLVPEAIRRMLGLEPDDRRVERSLAAFSSTSKGRGFPSPRGSSQSVDVARSIHKEELHAKRFLGSGGSLSEALGTELRAGEIARAMRPEEIHDDVRSLFDRIGALSGIATKGPEVVIRS